MILAIAVPCGIVYSHICNATALTSISTRLSPHMYPHLTTDTTSSVWPHTCRSVPCIQRNASLSIIYTIECKRTTRTHISHHVQNDSDSPPQSWLLLWLFILSFPEETRPTFAWASPEMSDWSIFALFFGWSSAVLRIDVLFALLLFYNSFNEEKRREEPFFFFWNCSHNIQKIECTFWIL